MPRMTMNVRWKYFNQDFKWRLVLCFVDSYLCWKAVCIRVYRQLTFGWIYFRYQLDLTILKSIIKVKFVPQVQFSDVDVLWPGQGGHGRWGVSEELQQRKLTFSLPTSPAQLCELSLDTMTKESTYLASETQYLLLNNWKFLTKYTCRFSPPLVVK